jgi:hypothetical protein
MRAVFTGLDLRVALYRERFQNKTAWFDSPFSCSYSESWLLADGIRSKATALSTGRIVLLRIAGKRYEFEINWIQKDCSLFASADRFAPT